MLARLCLRVLPTGLLAGLAVAVCVTGPTPVAAQPATLDLVFSYGSEKKEWLEEVTKAFNAKRVAGPNGQVIHVTLIAMGSGECVDALLDPEKWDREADEKLKPAAKAHLTSPASSAFFHLANGECGKPGPNKELLVDLKAKKNLVQSPVVIATWKPMAEALGWPQKRIGWAEVFDLATDPKGWAKVDRPQFGRFKFAHTNPELSNSGLISVLAETYAGANARGNLDLAMVNTPQVREFLTRIEQSVDFYGQSTGFLGAQMVKGGPALLSAAVLYEDQVIKANENDAALRARLESKLVPTTAERDAIKKALADRKVAVTDAAVEKELEKTLRGQLLEMPMVAIYPKEGTFWSDHPVAVVNRKERVINGKREDWVTPAHAAAAEKYIAYLREPEQLKSAMKYGFRPGEGIALDAKKFSEVNGVDAAEPRVELEVPEAAVMKKIKELWAEVKKPIRIVLVIDTSASMRVDGKMLAAKKGAADFVTKFGPRDELSILTFNTDIAWAIEEPLRMDAAGVKRAEKVIGELFADKETALYDAIEVAFEKVKAEQKPKMVRDRATAIVVLTDGEDTKSKQKLDPLLRSIKYDPEVSATRVFTIAYGKDANPAILKQIAEATRASQFEGTPEDIKKVFKKIYEEQ